MSEPKQYSFKPIETQLLQTIIQQHQALLSNMLSFIAIERLAVSVSADTRFELDPDLKGVTISEPEPEGIIETAPVKEKK